MQGLETRSCGRRRWRTTLGRLAFAGLALAAITGCQTPYVMVAPEVSTQATKLGPAAGSDTSHLALALGTAYYFIPIGWSGRAENAYDEAVASVPGATALGNVTIQENWYWWAIAVARPLSIEGEAVTQ